MSGEDVNVKFGGSTGGLDAAANKAKADIKSVSDTAKQATGTFGALGQKMKGMFADIKQGFSTGWAQGLQDASEKAKNLGENADIAGVRLGGMAKSMGVVALAAVGISAAIGLVKWGAAFGDAAEQLDKTAQKLNMTATEVSKWNALATTAGMSTSSFASSATRLERAMFAAANGGKAQKAAFDQLGISIDKNSTATGTLLQISDKFKTMENGPKKIAAAMTLMGRSGAEMIPIFNQGSEAIKEQFELADQYGAVISESMQAAGLAVDNAMDEMSLGMQGVKNTLFEALAPAIVATTEFMNDMVKSFIDSYRAGGVVKTTIDIVVGALKVAITATATVITAFRVMWNAIQGITTAVVGSAMVMARVWQDVKSGNLVAAAANAKAGFSAVGKEAVKSWGDAKNAVGDYQKFVKTTWGKGPKGTKPQTGGELGDLSTGAGKGTGSKKKDTSVEDAKRAAEEKRRIAEQALRAELEDLDYKQDLAKENYDTVLALEEEKLAKIKAFYGEDSREYTKAMRAKTRLEMDHVQDVIRLNREKTKKLEQIAEMRADTERDLLNISLDAEREHFDALDSLGNVSNAQRIASRMAFQQKDQAAQVAHENKIFQIKTQSIKDQIALDGLLEPERAKLLSELELLQVEHEGKMLRIAASSSSEIQRINDMAAQQTADKWRGMIEPIGSAFDGFLQSMWTRSQSFSQGLIQMADQIVGSFISMGVKMAQDWIMREIMKTTATQAQNGIRVASDATAAAVSSTTSAAAGLTQVTTNAAVGASGAFAATAPIPFVGPGLAPGVAAAAMAAILGFGGMIASAAGGYDIPAGVNPMTQLHEKEMVLPAKFAVPLRQMLQGAGPQGGSLGAAAAGAGAAARSEVSSRKSESTFNYQPKHDHMNADLSTLLRKDAATMRRWIRNEARNGKMGSMD